MVKQIKMKKIIIAAALLMVGCSKEEITKTPVKNCNCDRIVSAFRYTLLSSVNNNTSTKQFFFAKVTTVNDCSGWQREWTYRSESSRFSKKIGDCY